MLFDPSTPDAFWLDVTNAALGVFCLVCLLAIAWGVWHDVALKMRQRRIQILPFDPHAHFDAGLGPSMADGGEPVDRHEPTDETSHDPA